MGICSASSHKPYIPDGNFFYLALLPSQTSPFPNALPNTLSAAGHGGGFLVLPKRWIVARTFSWIGRQRRLSKDNERLTSTTEAWIYLVGIRLLLARLA